MGSEAMTEGEDHERDLILEVETEKTQKELDEEIKRKKEKQRFLDDVGVLTAMVTITLIAVLVVLIKVLIVHSEDDQDPPTFQPMEQMKGSKIKYTGTGYIHCDGIVPCPSQSGN